MILFRANRTLLLLFNIYWLIHLVSMPITLTCLLSLMPSTPNLGVADQARSWSTGIRVGWL